MTNISTRDKVIIIITGTRGVETLSTLALFSQQRDFGVAAVANGGHSTSNRALAPPIHISRKIQTDFSNSQANLKHEAIFGVGRIKGLIR